MGYYVLELEPELFGFRIVTQLHHYYRATCSCGHCSHAPFIGWLISDGYAAYRSHPKRQRCLAHLIRKAVAVTGAINQKAAQIGQWILDDLRELIAKIADAGKKEIPKVGKLLERLTRVCHLGKKVEHTKLQALAKEILNDSDAVVAFVKLFRHSTENFSLVWYICLEY